MDKKTFNLVSVTILLISLLYVPTKTCNAYVCVSSEWALMTSIEGPINVDYLRLVLQELVVGLVLFGIFQFKSND